jgi:hypothetical protein
VQHIFVNGSSVERGEQYVDRVFHDNDTEATWRGKFIKDPSVTMTGTVKLARCKGEGETWKEQLELSYRKGMLTLNAKRVQ